MSSFKTMSAALTLSVAFALPVLCSAEAAAQQRDPAAAEALFDQAREFIKQGRYAEACPKLYESNRLDPGIGTQFHLAECYEKNGQIATAWATFLDVASQARAASQNDRELVATKRATALEPRLPKLNIDVPEPSQVPGLEVRRDGIVVSPVQWGVPLPVDPGEHKLVISAAGYVAVTQTLKLQEAKPLTFSVPVLQSTGKPAAAPPVQAPAPAPLADAAPPAQVAPPAKISEDEMRPAAKSGVDAVPFVLIGAGVVGLAVGSVFALKANSNNTKSKADCQTANTNVCGPDGVSLRNTARSEGNIATAGFVAGGALLAAGGLVWALEYRAEKKSNASLSGVRASAALAPGHAALYLQGEF